MGKTSISEILSTYHHLQLENANEAATRLKVIDRVLKESLCGLIVISNQKNMSLRMV